MKASIKKMTEKQLVLRYHKGYSTIAVVAILSFFFAGLAYWFIGSHFGFDDWKYAGPLMKRTPNEVLFRMPLLNSHKIIYVPLDDVYIKELETGNSQLVFIGRTSERLGIKQKYTFPVKTYRTKEDANLHLQEARGFLKSADPIFLKFRTAIPDRRSNAEKWFPYAPFGLATLATLIALLSVSTHSKLTIDKFTGEGKLQKGTFLFHRSWEFKADELVDASVTTKEAHNGTDVLLTLELHLKNDKKLNICQYNPPYKDDKMIAGLSQHARLITWWIDDEISKYGERMIE